MQSAASSAQSAPPAAPPSFRIIPSPLSCWRATHHEHTIFPDRSFHQFLNTQYLFTQHWEFFFLISRIFGKLHIKKQHIIVTPPKRHCHSYASTLKAGGCDFVVEKDVFGSCWRDRKRACADAVTAIKSLTDVQTLRRPGPDWDREPAVAVGSHAAALDRRCSLRCSGTTSDVSLRNFSHL